MKIYRICLMLAALLASAVSAAAASYVFDGTAQALPNVNPQVHWQFTELDARKVLERTTVAGQWAALRLPQPKGVADFSWKIEFKPIGHPQDVRWSATSFWFRMSESNFDHGYLLSVRPDRFELRHRAKDVYTTLAQAPNTLFGQWQTLLIRADGSAITVYVNGEKLFEVEDGSYAKGDFIISNIQQRAAIGRMEIADQQVYEARAMQVYGPAAVRIPSRESYRAVVLGDGWLPVPAFANAVRWGLAEPREGVAVDPFSGELSVEASAKPGLVVLTAALADNAAVKAERSITLAEGGVVALQIEGSGAVSVPGRVQFTAYGRDAFHSLDWLATDAVRWSLAGTPVAGVAIDPTSGLLAVSAAAAAGAQVQVQAQSLQSPSVSVSKDVFIGDLLKSSLRSEVSVLSGILGRDIPVAVYHRDPQPEAGGVGKGVLYIRNTGAPRIGREADADILNDYLSKGWTVVTLDYGRDARAVSPLLEKELHGFFNNRANNKVHRRLDKSLFGAADAFRPHTTYILPEGYRVREDVPYYDLQMHAPNGLLEKMLRDWNEKIAPAVAGIEPAEQWQQMHVRNGQPIRTGYVMDVVYPSDPEQSVPLMVRFATDLPKDPNMGGDGTTYHFTGFTLRGGAYALVEHVHDPLYSDFWKELGSDNYSHVRHIGLGSAQAAFRQLAAHSERYGIDPEHFFGSGHSKGQYFVTRMLNPAHEAQAEWAVLDGFPAGSAEPQPFGGYTAKMRAGYQSAGWGNWLHSGSDSAGNRVLVQEYLPTMIAVGAKDPYPVVPPFHRFVARLKELGVADYVPLLMPEIGHNYPYGWNPDLNRDNYEMYVEFFERHMPPQSRRD